MIQRRPDQDSTTMDAMRLVQAMLQREGAATDEIILKYDQLWPMDTP